MEIVRNRQESNVMMETKSMEMAVPQLASVRLDGTVPISSLALKVAETEQFSNKTVPMPTELLTSSTRSNAMV